MPADPSDIARYTTPGTLVISPIDKADADEISAKYIDAKDLLEEEIEMFYVDADDAQEILDQIWAMRKSATPPYMAVEVDDTLRLGTSIPIAPSVPTAEVSEAAGEPGQNLRVRAFAAELGTERYVVELLGE